MALWVLHLSSLMPKDDICVAKYDFDGLGPQMVERFVHFMEGWVGLVVWQETKWINLLIPHKGKQGEDVWAANCGCPKPVKIRLS